MAQVNSTQMNSAQAVPSLLAMFRAALPEPNGERSLTLAGLKTLIAGLPERVAALPDTRFARLRPWLAALLLAIVASLTVWGFVLAAQPGAGSFTETPDPNNTDVLLYDAIAERVARGESYYTAVVDEQRARNYPLRPVVTVRFPTLATLRATLGPVAAGALLAALTLLAWALLMRRMVRMGVSDPVLKAAGVAALFGLAPGLVVVGAVWHEAWAATFIVLSLACRSRERWLASIGLALVACAFRELALPYLCVMAFSALVEGSRREAAAWLGAIAIVALGLAVHASTLSALVRPDDLASQGWVRAGGWSLILSMLSNGSTFSAFPVTVVSCLAILALLGWTAWPGGLGLRGALLMTGYVGAFMIVGRQDNVYWGLLWAPLLPIGLVMGPAVLRDLVRAARRRSGPVPRAA